MGSFTAGSDSMLELDEISSSESQEWVELSTDLILTLAAEETVSFKLKTSEELLVSFPFLLLAHSLASFKYTTPSFSL